MNLFSYDQKRDTFTLDQYTLAGSVLRAELERARAVATTCRERCIAGGKTAEGLAEYYLWFAYTMILYHMNKKGRKQKLYLSYARQIDRQMLVLVRSGGSQSPMIPTMGPGVHLLGQYLCKRHGFDKGLLPGYA